MSEIKVSKKTADRMESCEKNIKIIESTRQNILFTVLDELDINYDDTEITYDNGVITLNEKPKK